ncbi:hypothetical protein C0V97_04130 [Asaia sp. W19]|uniref:hypothetical protein n=1 Tax=unclassified Asaia TaxID=2685023 RepID=UPI000F8E458F|nr:hypothetical protein [Asaia sp. W19]RUT26875.1 hypothetical protein C0V97_04130 [Asaia sp. W19]
MANFIRLMTRTTIPGHHYVNIQHIAEFFAKGSGAHVILMSQNAEGCESYFVNETPDQILALIAEAQGAK